MNRTRSKEETSWDTVWGGMGHTDFHSLLKKRYAWPYEGFITNTARLLRAGELSLERSKILDFGCGQGRHAQFFARSGFQRVSGIDSSSEAVDLARAWSREEGYEIDFRSYDGRHMPYRDGEFDLVTCYGTFHHVPTEKQQALAREIARVVREGGHFLWAECSARTTRLPPGPRVGERTYVIDDPSSPEHGLEQHLLTLRQCRELFPQFEFAVGATEMLEGEALDSAVSYWNLAGRKNGVKASAFEAKS